MLVTDAADRSSLPASAVVETGDSLRCSLYTALR